MFKPDYTPRQMFSLGIFGGTYFRNIHSSITNKDYIGDEVIKEIKTLKTLSKKKLTNEFCDVSINKYKVDNC